MSKLGIGSFSGTNLPENVMVGNYSSIGEGVHFHSNGTHLAAVNHDTVFTTNFMQPYHPLPIAIAHDVWICDGARIFENISIGNGAIIGAGAVVTKNVPPYMVVAGNPAKAIRVRFTPEQIGKLESIKWWEWPEPLVRERIPDMLSIDTFLLKYYE